MIDVLNQLINLINFQIAFIIDIYFIQYLFINLIQLDLLINIYNQKIIIINQVNKSKFLNIIFIIIIINLYLKNLNFEY